MNQGFEFSFPFTLRDRLRATVALMPARRVGVLFNIVLPIVGLLGIALYLLGVLRNEWVFTFGFLFVVFPLCAILGTVLGYVFNPVAREPFRYVIDDQGIHVFAKSIDYTHRWSVISQAKRSAGFLMLFFKPGCAHCLPLKALEASGQLAELTAFLSARGLNGA
jgi:hypothetical protein